MDPLRLLPLIGILLVGVAAVLTFVSASRQRDRELASHWTGTVLRFEHTQGRRALDVGGTGSHIADPEHMYIWVHYRRDDGVVSYFDVREEDPYAVYKPPDEGKPSYEEVMRDWREGDRIEKQPGEKYPRRIAAS